MKISDKILIHSLLKRLEWSEWREHHQICPDCREAFKYGHKADCELKKSLEILLGVDLKS